MIWPGKLLCQFSLNGSGVVGGRPVLLKYEVTLRASRLDPRVVVAVQEPLVDQPVIHLFDIDEDDGTFSSIRPPQFLRLPR